MFGVRASEPGLLAFQRGAGPAYKVLPQEWRVPLGHWKLFNPKPTVDVFDAGGLADAQLTHGVLGVEITGRFAKRKPTVEVDVGIDCWMFSTGRVDAIRLPVGWHRVCVAQTRLGPNCGAVYVFAGQVTVLEYRPNWAGPPGGKFISEGTRVMGPEEFLDYRMRQGAGDG